MIVGYNEASLLETCLQSINFCDEIFYTDLGSSDDSIKIAMKYACNILHRDKKMVPSCEMVQTEVVNYTKHDWVIFIDPDENLHDSLKEQIINEFNKITTDPYIGAVSVPWQFYFKRHKLRGTVWGGENKKYFLVNKNRFIFLPIIHHGRILKNGFKQYQILLNKSCTNILHHHWMNSYKIFFKKHRRYLLCEARNQYNEGARSSLKKVLFTPSKEFYNSFVAMKGYKDFFIGFFLSLFWAYYKTHIALDIYFYQKKVNKK